MELLSGNFHIVEIRKKLKKWKTRPHLTLMLFRLCILHILSTFSNIFCNIAIISLTRAY